MNAVCSAPVKGHESPAAVAKCPVHGQIVGRNVARAVPAVVPALSASDDLVPTCIPFRAADGTPLIVDWNAVAFDEVAEADYGETFGDVGVGPEFSRTAILTFAEGLHLCVEVTTGASRLDAVCLDEGADDAEWRNEMDFNTETSIYWGIVTDLEDLGGSEVWSEYEAVPLLEPDRTLDDCIQRARALLAGDDFYGALAAGSANVSRVEHMMRHEAFEAQLRSVGVDPTNEGAVEYLEMISGHRGWPLEVRQSDVDLALSLHRN